MRQVSVFRLPAAASAVGTARARTRDLLLAREVGAQTCDDAVLVISELVTNVIAHTASRQMVCRLLLEAGRLHIEVEDQSTDRTFPEQRTPAPGDPCGRGLLLVAALSDCWGVADTPHGSGRIVWAELPSAPPATTPRPGPLPRAAERP